MRKILSILLTISIIFSCINFSVFAETEGALSISAPTSASPGETINVILNIPSNTNALTGSLNLVYDNTALSVVNCTSGTILNNRNVAINKTYAENKIRMSFDGDTPLTQGGILLNVSFNVLSGASGTVSFGVEKFKLLDENYETIDITETSTQMYIVNDAETKISVNCNDTVNTGEEITVTVDIKNSLNICGGGFNLVYDADKFLISSATAGSILSSFTKQLNKTYAANKVRLTWAGYSNMTQDGTILTVVFKAKNGVTGDAVFSVEKFSFGDLNGATYDGATTSSTTNVVCTHNVMNWIVTEEPSCNDTGVETYSCGCGHLTDTREVAATGHVEMEWVITKEATCDNTGVKEYTCKACGYVDGSEEIPAHGHIYESIITHPTQAEQGYTTHTCTDCGHSYKDTYTEATGYTISYEVNGGKNAPESQNKKSGESITLSDIIPTRTGYTFLGWATDKNAENAQYYAGNAYSEDADLVLYALWDAHEHTITYVVDGETVSVQTYDYEALINALAEPTKEGYTFSGWDEIPITMPDEDITISGSFTINSYIVSFDANGGENAPEELTDVYNSSVTIPEANPTKDGFIFLGWATSQKAKKAEYSVGDTITLIKDYNLYAVWVGIWSGTASESFSGGAGTKTNPYIIKTAEELKLIADKVNSGDTSYASACYIMVNDIALNDVSNVDNWATEAPANEWTPIGNTTYPFMGTFDGNGYTISGLYINKPKENNDNNKFLGVFGYASNSSLISNTIIDKSYIKGFSLIGGIVGQTQGSIKNCNNYSNLYGNYWTSGICGLVKTNGATQTPSVEKCTNYGVVITDEGFASGITTVISVDTPIEVKNCVNYGNVIGNATNGVGYGNGGIVSHANTAQYNVLLENCINYGNVSGAPLMGGISGYNHINSSGQIYYKNCTNYGKVADSKTQINCLGGITGSTTLADNLNTTNVHIFYENCANYGEISATWHGIGGIIGVGYTSQITNCYNAGYINCPDATGDYGGIAGYLGRGSSVLCSYNIGTLYGSGSIGGIVGSMYNETNLIENCANYGSVSQSRNGTHTGGICGYLIEGSTINNCINVATIADNNTFKGGIVGYNTGTVKDSFYLNTCGATGPGKALTYAELQSCANYSYYATQSTGTWKNYWTMGHNPYGVYPVPKGMTNLMEIPIEFDLNGGNFDDYVFSASIVPSQKNAARGVDFLVIYNNSNTSTGTNNHGYEVIVDSRNVVIDLKDLAGNNTVPNGGFVLSGHGMMHEWLQNNIELGDKVYYDANNYEVKVYKKNPKFNFSYGHITYLPTPHKDGYVFGGWYDEKDNLITYATKLYATDTLKLHAKWDVPEVVAETSYGTLTYKLYDTPTSYASAKKYCESLGGHLATITDELENDEIHAMLSKGTKSGYLIGSNDILSEGTFVWETGETMTYTNWSSSEPSDSTPGEDVVEIYTSNGMWNDIKDTYLSNRGFICEFDNYKPSTEFIYNGHLYQIYHSYENGVSWDYAKDFCESKGGHLVTITSEEENTAIINEVQKYTASLGDVSYSTPFFWIGASDVDSEGNWKWVTGEKWEYNSWNTAQPDNAGGQEHYAHMYTASSRLGKWNDLPNTYSTGVSYICEFDSISPVAEAEFNGHKYLLFDNSTSWSNAEAYCESIGGYLATLTSAEEENFVALLCANNSTQTGYYLGATDNAIEGTWQWITGEDWNYSNWGDSQPDDAGNNEDYLEIWDVSSKSSWNDIPNAHFSTRGFICEIGTVDNYIPVTIEINPANGHIYSVYDIKTSWSEAKQFCENIGGHLVTINDANENDYVVSLARDKGNLSKYYIGASDADTEGVWKWVTGEQFWSGNASGSTINGSYTNWLSGEPNNTGSVEHYAHIMDSYNWQWNDTADKSSMGIICEFETTYTPISEMVYNGHKYYLYDTPLTWTDAKVYSESIGGYLSVITSQEEQDAVFDMISSNGNKEKYYLGASNLENIDEWKWVNGEKFSYSNWGEGMPHNVGLGNENFLMMYKSDGYWNDLKNYFGGTGNSDRGFVVELDDLNTCTITYHSDGGTNIPEAQIEILNDTATISSKEPQKIGCIFKGWTTVQSGTTVEYNPDDSITIKGDLVLYAIWEKVTYSITYDANGGINAPDVQIFNYGDEFTITPDIPSYDGFEFVGWATSSDATKAEYVIGDSITIINNVKFYALWKAEDNESEKNEGVIEWNVVDNTLTISGAGSIFDYTQGNAPWYEYKEKITSIVIGDNVTSIGDYAFYGLGKVTSVDLGGVMSIGNYAFSNCSSLSSIDISKVTEFGSYAFRFCSALTEIVVVSDEVKYGNNVFSNCTGINSVTVNDRTTKIPSKLLNNCGIIASISIPDSIVSIEENAFVDTSFTNVTFEGTKDEFAKLLTTENTLLFDKVVCITDSKTYIYTDFFAETINITSISFEKKSLGLYVGESAVLVAQVTPSNTTEGYSWSSDNELVAKVDDYGTVIALGEGIANITVISESGTVKASCVIYVNAVADENAPAITVGSIEEIKNGDSFDVNISIKNNPGITSMRLNLAYDNSVMELTNITDLGLIGGSLHSEDYTSNNYVLYWDNGTSKTNFTQNGDIVTLTFKVKDNTKSGDYPLVISYNTQDIINCELVPVSFDIVNGYVTVKAFTYGDVNDDESVDTIDSAYLSRYIARWTGVSINSNAADVNKDKKVNVLDSAILKRHIANWTDYRTLPYSEPISLLSAATLNEYIKPTIVVSDVKGQCGKTVDITISIKDNPGIVSMRLDVEYDKDAMTLTKVTDTGLLPGAVHGNELLDMPYCLYWDNGSSNTDYTVNGNLVTLTFLLKENVDENSYPITISYNYDEPDIINTLLKPVSIDIDNGQISVVEVTEPQIALSNVVIGEKTNYTLQLLSPDTISGVVFIATYDKNTSRLCTLEKYDAMAQKDFSVDTKNGEIVKIMWWDGINSLRPIADSVIVNEE